MSVHCEQVAIPLTELSPRFVHFTGTRGVLRCMREGEELRDARGVVFLCPKCKDDRQAKHFNIFLFESAPPEARPAGRFAPVYGIAGPKIVPAHFQVMSLFGIQAGYAPLKPHDVPCKWSGHLSEGVVSWRPGSLP